MTFIRALANRESGGPPDPEMTFRERFCTWTELAQRFAVSVLSVTSTTWRIQRFLVYSVYKLAVLHL